MKSTFLNHTLAEFYKLKSTPVIYLVGLCCAFVLSIVIVAHSMDVNSVALDADPWRRCFNAGLGIFSFFVMGPFIILLVTAMIYIEQRANAWKLLYTMPVSRGNIYFSKLLVMIFIIMFSLLLLVFCLVGVGYFLDTYLPELEFNYYPPPVLEALQNIGHNLIASLGILGLQYFLCLWFRNFLIPLSIGIIGVVLGFILITTNTDLVLYLPFSYPMGVKDYGMFRSDKIELILGDWLTNVELYSLLYFLFFITLGYFYERWRNVD